MLISDPLFEQADQCGIIDPEHFSRWRLDIDGESRCVGKKRVYTRRHALSLPQIGRFCSFVRMTEARSIQQHLFLLPPGQVRKALGRSGAPESKEAVSVDNIKPTESPVQILARRSRYRTA